MNDRWHQQTVRIAQKFTSHIPIPYGCMTLIALILGVVSTVVASTFAIGSAIFK
jgi:hypothetical protein